MLSFLFPSNSYFAKQMSERKERASNQTQRERYDESISLSFSLFFSLSLSLSNGTYVDSMDFDRSKSIAIRVSECDATLLGDSESGRVEEWPFIK